MDLRLAHSLQSSCACCSVYHRLCDSHSFKARICVCKLSALTRFSEQIGVSTCSYKHMLLRYGTQSCHCVASAGCATAKSYISATALSQTNTDYKSIYTQQIQSYTAAMCAQGWSPDVLSAYASQAADAFATATSYALSHYYTYACTCCKGNSVAYSSVKASIQAVAAAQAFAMSQAIAAVTDCDGNVLSYGSGIAQVIKKLVLIG
jgi:hypothetical protein